jgi:hypothetical protein
MNKQPSWEEDYENSFNKTFGFGMWHKVGHPETETVSTTAVLEWHRNFIRSQIAQAIEKEDV